MPERSLIEKPFLHKLAAPDWSVVDQRPGIPTDPATRLRTSFRKVILSAAGKGCIIPDIVLYESTLDPNLRGAERFRFDHGDCLGTRC